MVPNVFADSLCLLDHLTTGTACTAESSCGSIGVEVGCSLTKDTTCRVPCVSGAAFSVSGNSPCQSCAATSTCPNGEKNACTPTSDTVCDPTQKPTVFPATLQPGSAALPVSGSDKLLTLSRINAAAPKDAVPVGRSYGGEAWEVTAGRRWEEVPSPSPSTTSE